jgi:uncharacterized protein YjiS (DUF1127 family)
MLTVFKNHIKNIINTISERIKKNRTMRELSHLSDKDLLDIGINPGDVPGRNKTIFPLHYYRFNRYYSEF